MDKPDYKRPLLKSFTVLAILMAAQLACSVMGGGTAGSTKTPTLKADETSVKDSQIEIATQGVSEGGDGFACFGTVVNGVTCLTTKGWKTYTTDNSNLIDDSFQDMAACPDGKIYGVTTVHMEVFDGTRWENIPVGGEDEYQGAEYVACGPDGSIWAGYSEGVSRYRNGEWTTFPSTSYYSGDVGLIYGLEVAPDGTVWVATESSVSAYDGAVWKEYKQGKEFGETFNLMGLAVDSKSRVWALGAIEGYLFENGEWGLFDVEMGDYSFPYSVTVDPQDRLWVNTSDEGVLVFDGSKWTEPSFPAGRVLSNGVYMTAFDPSGSTWLALTYGVEILTGNAQIHYRMDNSGLAENEITTIAVVGTPPLPEETQTSPGSIIGRVTRGGTPLAEAEVGLCVEFMSITYTKDTPCSNQPFMKTTTTDAEGSFSIQELPIGYYVLTVNVGAEWTLQTTVGYDRILVEEGKDTDLGEVVVEED